MILEWQIEKGVNLLTWSERFSNDYATTVTRKLKGGRYNIMGLIHYFSHLEDIREHATQET